METLIQDTVRQAGLLLKENRVDDALSQLQGAFVQAPDDFAVNHMLGAALMKAGRRPEAIARLLKATQINPGHAGAHTHLGMAYAAADKHEMARTALQAALRADPNFAPAQGALAKLPASVPIVPKGKVTTPLSAPAPLPAGTSKGTAKNDTKDTAKTAKVKAKPAAPKKEIDWPEVTLQVLGGVFLVLGLYLRFVHRIDGMRVYNFPGLVCIVIGISMLKAGFPSKDDWKDDFR